jgi:hypothetical protein
MSPTLILMALASHASNHKLPGLGVGMPQRIRTALSILGSNDQTLNDRFGMPSATGDGDSVWVYGGWTPSPRIGFSCSFLKEKTRAKTLTDTVQYVTGSVGKVNPQALRAVQPLHRDGSPGSFELIVPVARDYAWLSGEKTVDIQRALKADHILYYAQFKDPRTVLATCTVGGKHVYIFSREVDGGKLVPVLFGAGAGKTYGTHFDPAKLDAYSFSVGSCVKWQYTAGPSREMIVGPGSSSSGDGAWIMIL